MLRFTKNLKSTRLGVKRRAETDESSLARTKFANGPLFVWSSPNQQNKHWLVDENEKKYDGLESRYIEGKVGHQEVPIKDWLMPKPTRWQVEWSKYWMVGKFVDFMFQGFIFSIYCKALPRPRQYLVSLGHFRAKTRKSRNFRNFSNFDFLPQNVPN